MRRVSVSLYRKRTRIIFLASQLPLVTTTSYPYLRLSNKSVPDYEGKCLVNLSRRLMSWT